MNLVFQLILSLILVLAFYQDWKYRAIHWFVFPLLAIVSVLVFLWLDLAWEIIGFNLIFVTLVIGCLFLYVSLKEGRLTNIFAKHFGIGDVLFFLAVTPLFSVSNFILFFITGMFLAGIVHLVISRNKPSTVPLAGYLSIYIIGLLATDFVFDLNLFYTDFLG